MMNFTYVEFPCSVNLNTFKAYIDPKRCLLPKIHGMTTVDDVRGEGEQPNPVFKSLRHLVLDAIIERWEEYPIYEQLPGQVDRNYLLSNLATDLPLKTLSEHIQDDCFWRRCYEDRWKVLRTPKMTTDALLKPAWINGYMERHLQEFVQQLDPGDYETQRVRSELDICDAYINHLEIDYLQPSTREQAVDGFLHIPFDFLLSSLLHLRTLRLTYAAKTLGFHYFPGCNKLSQNDVIYLARGLSRCHELQSFCLHNTKLEAYQLRFLARGLDKGCHQLTSLSLVHTAIGDKGLLHFLDACNRDSFLALKTLDLTNNKITAEGALHLSRTFKGRSMEKLVLRRNPIGSDGAAAILSMLHQMPVTFLDLGACSLSDTITRLFMQLIVQNRSLVEVDITNNDLNEEFGKQLYKIIGFNKTLQNIDLRNTSVSLATRNKLKQVLEKNAKKDLFNKKLHFIWYK